MARANPWAWLKGCQEGRAGDGKSEAMADGEAEAPATLGGKTSMQGREGSRTRGRGSPRPDLVGQQAQGKLMNPFFSTLI